MRRPIDYLTPKMLASEAPIWINPVGGMGDIIMLSTAIKHSYDKYGKKFSIARRSQYTEFFQNHPAVQEIGNPPIGSNIVCNDYWMREEFKDINTKALAINLKIFGVEPEGNDMLFLPERELDDSTRILIDTIPWQQKNVMIVCSSESPRKIMHPIKWHKIVEKLLAQQCFIVQVGRSGEIHIHGTYSLLGTTRPLQVIELLKKVDLLITPDNYVMHAAKVTGTPTIALFGPTEACRYGYSDHFCLQADNSYCEFADKCLGPHVAGNYATPCPMEEKHCMNTHDEKKIVDISMTIINK